MDIRSILNIINENSQEVKVETPFSDNFVVMSLDQFLHSEGVVPEEEEVDEAKLDAPHRTMSKDEMNKYLDRIKGTPIIDPNTGQSKKTPRGTEKYVSGKTKQDRFKIPYVHRSNVPIVNDDGQKYDLDKLRSSITKRPTKILKQNEKMQHSDGTASAFYNVGLPALKGLAVNEDTNDFIIVDTCTGAGVCQTYCYAMKGGYVQWKGVSLGQTRLLNFLYNDPQGFMDMLGAEIQENSRKLQKIDKRKGTETTLIIRWHDAGDFFSPQYLEYAYNLARKYPNVDFYAYTKLASVAQGAAPGNFKMNYSMGAKPNQEKQIDFAKTKNSRVVPEELFNDLIAKDGIKVKKDAKGRTHFASRKNLEAFKQRLAAKYSIEPSSIWTYDEMMSHPAPKEKPDVSKMHNVIVMPGEGDDGANRNDILNSFLLIH